MCHCEKNLSVGNLAEKKSHHIIKGEGGALENVYIVTCEGHVYQQVKC